MRKVAALALVAALVGTALAAPGNAQTISKGQIAYARPSAVEDQDIYVMNPDGTYSANLTATPTVSEFDPAFSRDGTRLAFAGYQNAGPADVYVMSSTGADRRRLTSTSDFEGAPQFSPDGTKIAYLRDENESERNVWLMNADGTSPQRITNGGSVELSGLSWRPDGGAILFSQQTGGLRSDYDIFEVSLGDLSVRRVLSRPGFDTDPRYSPDGTRIAFLGEATDVGTLHAFVVNPDGSGLVPVSQTGYHYSLDWAPDGSTMVMGRSRGRAQEIVTAAPGTTESLITNEIATDIAWQPCSTDCRLSTATAAQLGIAAAFPTRRGLKVIVLVAPGHVDHIVEVTLYRRRDGRFRKVETIPARILRTTVAEPVFRNAPARGACRAVAVFPADDDHLEGRAARRFPCAGQVAG